MTTEEKRTYQFPRIATQPAKIIPGSDALYVDPQHEYTLMVCACCGERFVSEIEATPSWLCDLGNPNAVNEVADLGAVCGRCLVSPLVAARRALAAAQRFERLAFEALIALDIGEYNRLSHVELGYRDTADLLRQRAADFQNWPTVEHDPDHLDRLYGELPGEKPGVEMVPVFEEKEKVDSETDHNPPAPSTPKEENRPAKSIADDKPADKPGEIGDTMMSLAAATIPVDRGKAKEPVRVPVTRPRVKRQVAPPPVTVLAAKSARA